jgi:uncharacterized membrane protein
MSLKSEKKENMERMRAYRKVMEQNKKVNKINFTVLAAGLILMVLNITVLGVNIGYYILWIGILILFMTGVSSLSASWASRRQK